MTVGVHHWQTNAVSKAPLEATSRIPSPIFLNLRPQRSPVSERSCLIDSFPSPFRFAPARLCELRTIRCDFLPKPVAVSAATRSTSTRLSIARMGEAGPSKMALYSLVGNPNSPFHAEPAQFSIVSNIVTGISFPISPGRIFMPTEPTQTVPLPRYETGWHRRDLRCRAALRFRNITHGSSRCFLPCARHRNWTRAHLRSTIYRGSSPTGSFQRDSLENREAIAASTKLAPRNPPTCGRPHCT